MSNSENMNIENNETQTEFNYTYEQLMMLASGIDEENRPVTAATLAIDKINEDGEQVEDRVVVFDNAVIDFFVSGGCLVMQVDFPANRTHIFKRAVEYISDYLDNAQDEDYAQTHAFGVVAVPMVFRGKISVVLQDLVYFTGFELPNADKRLILCFNDLVTQVIDNGDEINYDEIESNVLAQINREQRQMEDEIAAINQEIEELSKYNPYEENILERYTNNHENNAENDDSSNKWMRIAKDE